jgi:hypothetical protein
MDDVIETILRTSGATDACSRERISKYIRTLNSAGQRDFRALETYGRAYLKEMREGRDTRYSGC